MSNITITTEGTAAEIIKSASFDFGIKESFSSSDTFRETHKEAAAISDDMSGQQYDWTYFKPQETLLKNINILLKYILFFPGGTIQIQQTAVNPYIFKFSTPSPNGYVGFFPLLMARKLLYIIKAYGYKIIPDKRDRSITPERIALFRDLCYRGKTEVNLPVYTPLAKIAKKIKVTVNGWEKSVNAEDEKEDDNTVNQASIRFRSAEWFNAVQQDVDLIGAGGLGSNIAVSLCRLLGNKNLRIYDPDTIEYKNLAGQNFGISDIGQDKAKIVLEQCKNFNPCLSVNGINMPFENFNSGLSLATITGLDNMASRSLVYYKWLGEIKKLPWVRDTPVVLLDARLSAETWQVFCITSDNKKAQEEYESKWLFSDEEADEGVCSYKQTAFAAQMCASFVTNLYVNFCTNSIKEKDDPTRRFLPFMTEYDASQMILRFQDI